MLRIIQKLLPSFTTNENVVFHPKIALISIIIDDSCFLIGCEYADFSDNFKSMLQNDLITTLNCPNLSLNIIPKIPLDAAETVSFSLQKNSFTFTLSLPIDFLNFLSNYFAYTFHFKAQNILDLHLEMYRFRPQLLNLQHRQYGDLFHQMLTHSLATPRMLALFFKKMDIVNISRYFSKKTSQEISKEISKLSEIEDSNLLNSIYYLIERNIIVFLQEYHQEHFQEYNRIINYYQEYFLRQALPNIQLEQLFESLKYSPQLPLSLKSSPYHSLLSFLSFSHPDNILFLQRGFSQQGFKILLEDLQQTKPSILNSKDFLWTITKYYPSTIPFEDLVIGSLYKERGWEFLARECDIRDIILCLDSYKIRLEGIWNLLYHSYQQKIIVFPKLANRPLVGALDHCRAGIQYLKMLGLLS
ncbi:MAG: hypothetical protein ACRCWI_07510 [Brevinema sp.]